MANEEQTASSVPWLAAAVYHAAFLLFTLELIYDMLFGGMLRVAGVQAQDIALLLLFGFLGINDARFQRMMLTPLPVIAFALLIGFAALGVLFGNSIGWIRTDLRILLWIPGGLALFYLLPKTRNPGLHLFISNLICLYMLYLGQQESLANHFSDVDFKAGEARLYSLNLFSVGVIMLPLMGVYTVLYGRRSLLHRLAGLGFIGAWLYYIVVLSATRNLMLSFAAMAVAYLPYYLLRKRDGLSIPAWNGTAVACTLGAFAIMVAVAGSMQHMLVFERFGTGDFMREDSARERVEELIAVYHNFDKVALVSGSGLGTVFRPYASYEANFLHLGLFTFLFKFGVLGFVGIVIFFYFLVPFLLARASFDAHAFSDHRRTALLIALPPLMPWIVQTSISSGFTNYNFMAAGMCLALFLEIDSHGVRRLLK